MLRIAWLGNTCRMVSRVQLDSSRGQTVFTKAIVGLIVAMAMILSGETNAQDANGEGDVWAGVEEMLVVGSAAGSFGLLEQTGSIVAFDASDLAAYGIENTTDLATYTPNLEIVQSSATQASFFIRGVGLQNFSANSTGAVAVYLDGVPLASPTLQIAPIFDLEGVEVLRGPQGQGNYRNASAGVISIRTRKPSLDSFAVNATISQGQFTSRDSFDAYTRRYDAGVSIPIIPDILATRFAFQLKESDGLFKNRCAARPDEPGLSVCGEGPGTAADPVLLPRGLKEQIGNESVFSLRSSWLFIPPTKLDLEISASVYYSLRDQDGRFGQAIGTGSAGGGPVLGRKTTPSGGNRYEEPDARAEIDGLVAGGLDLGSAERAFADNFTQDRPLDKAPFDGDFNKNGRVRVEIVGGSINFAFNTDVFDFSSTVAVAHFDAINEADTDFIPNTLFEVDEDSDAIQYSVDLALKGELEAVPLNWNVGMFLLSEELNSDSFLDLDISFINSRRVYSQDTLSAAVFAGFELDFWDDFTLSMGARFNHERKKFDITQTTPGLPAGVRVRQASESITWQEPTGTVELLYRFSDSASAYVKFNHGFKPGHFNSNGMRVAQVGIAAQVREPAEKEVIDSFEVGMTLSSWDQRIGFSAALFHYDYHNYQVFIFEDTPNGPPTLQVINANDARVLGAEIDLTIDPLIGFVPSPIEGLQIRIRGGWLDSKFLDFQNTSLLQSGATIREIVSDFTGNTLINAPEFQISGGATWRFGLGRFGEITPRYDFSWTDDVFFDPAEGRGAARPNGAQLPEFTLGQKAYIRHNVSLAYRPRDLGVTLTGWCRNVTDQRTKTFAFDVSRFRNVVISLVGDPRSCGADLAFEW